MEWKGNSTSVKIIWMNFLIDLVVIFVASYVWKIIIYIKKEIKNVAKFIKFYSESESYNNNDVYGSNFM